MPGLTLYMGNRNYSSWSLRGWLVLRAAGLEFDEFVFHLGEEGVRDAIGRHSPTSRVPALEDHGLIVWDSLAIAEYAAELAPGAGLWPSDRGARAVARAVCAEMHSSFGALRTELPMNIRRRGPGPERSAELEADIERIEAIWLDCRRRFGPGGAFLFGDWTVADCFFAPVVSRFRSYEVELAEPLSRTYMEAVWAQPDFSLWREKARDEATTISTYEI